MGKRNYLLALSFLLLVLVIIIGSRFFILKNKYEKLAFDFAMQILESEQTTNSLKEDKKYLVNEYNDQVSFIYPLGVEIEEIITYNNYIPGKEMKPDEVPAFVENRKRWESRLNNKSKYRIGDECFETDTFYMGDQDEIGSTTCEIYNLSNNFTIKYTDKDSFDYIIIDEFSEYKFSFPKESDDVFNVILNSFKYTRN